MLYIKQKQVKVVLAETAEEFESKLNSALSEVKDMGVEPDVHFNFNMGLCAVLLYSVTSPVAENTQDKYELKGIEHVCSFCPLCEMPKDSRFKYFRCVHSNTKMSPNDPCCEWYYEQLERSGWRVRVDETASADNRTIQAAR